MKTMNGMSDQLNRLLTLCEPAFTVTFLREAPSSVNRVANVDPAGCSYWKRASRGEIFYTDPADHMQCPIGGFTHGVELTDEKKEQLGAMMKMMMELGYLRENEIPAIPHRSERFEKAVYAPLGAAPCVPDVVMIKGNARQLMLLSEAAQSAGVLGDQPTMGRPTCAIIPQAIATRKTASSFACVGNRVYTGTADGEAYFAIPFSVMEQLLPALETVVNANARLEEFHRSRLN